MAQSLNTLLLGIGQGSDKLAAVTGLLEKLSRDLKDANLSPRERDAALEELKVYGRDPRGSDPIFTKEGIRTLGGHAFDSSSVETSRNALRCIANAMLLNPNTRQLVVDLGLPTKACRLLGRDDWDDELLISRVLLLSTYAQQNLDLPSLISDHRLAEGVVERLAKHAEWTAADTKKDSMEEMSLTETARLLFNVTHFCPEKRKSFAAAVPHILSMLWKRPLPSTKVLDAPIGPLVNAVADLDLENDDSDSALFPDADPKGPATRLIKILDLSLEQSEEAELDVNVTAVVVILGRVHGLAPKIVREFMQESLLPASTDREQVLGQTSSLSSRLLKHLNNSLAPALGKAIYLLLFDLSDKDAAKFIQNVGYGFASGFLFQNDIPIPDEALQAAGETPNSSDARAGMIQRDVNPITGQFLDAEKAPPDLPAMTDEEKEREAERLFVLFERLKKTGIVDVQNPVEKAYQEGRFEELDDDDDEEEERQEKKNRAASK